MLAAGRLEHSADVTWKKKWEITDRWLGWLSCCKIRKGQFQVFAFMLFFPRTALEGKSKIY